MLYEWVVMTMLFGSPTPVDTLPRFTNESGCILFLNSNKVIADSFRLTCEKRIKSE